MNTTPWKSDVFAAFDTSGDWTGGAGPPTNPDAIPFDTDATYGDAASAAGVEKSKGAKLTTLVDFTGADGANPFGSLIADAAGNLLGTASAGGTDNDGTVFEIAKTKGGYASAPTTLVSFTGADGETPYGSLITDAAGDLFGASSVGGASGNGTVFEIVKTKHGYASAPTTLVSFTGMDGESPYDSLITDAAGDLFGMTEAGGSNSDGTVFEIAKTKGGYASAPTTLASFTGADGANPNGSLIADAAGDLFGTTSIGGALNLGTVFEIAKTKGGYASAPTTLVSFTGADGSSPLSTLIADAAGDLFGTTSAGGANNDGTVFEIAKTKGGYSGAPTTLVSFDNVNGAYPDGALIADAAGNLFGTTQAGGTDKDGTVFEIAKTRNGYASAPTTLASFDFSDGAEPIAALFADATGNLYGTTSVGGADTDGTVFEITHSGFVPQTATVQPAHDAIAHVSTLSAAFVQAMASHGPSLSGEATPTFLVARHKTATLLSRPQLA
jgi:uncharacterized repeat protein (TIGR03803 family)